ncbi:EamA family transporter [Nocardia sp. NPDC050406]|uniref:EamA family transporter n=1 Tax=Nocardia sp. NPDC050406 TaxID=3364318 RepID=UPI00379957CE
MGMLLALVSALSYGLSDFLGGIASRRVGFARVALLGQLGGLLCTLVAAPLVSSGTPHVADLAWGALSGAGTGVAMTFLFRGIARGAMSVVVPVSAVGGVALPVLVGAAVLGERPAVLVWGGIALVLPALWLVADGSKGSGPGIGDRRAVADGLIASVGIAVQYLALAEATPASGIWPVTAGRVAAVVLVAVIAARFVVGAGQARQVRVDLMAGFSGVLAALALVAYLIATRTEFLAVAVVLSSLYPIVPVALGVWLLKERLRLGQIFGLVAALAATVMIAIA